MHPHADLAALASEAAADQDAFWEMHDQLLEHRDKLRIADAVSYADRLGPDVSRFTRTCKGTTLSRAFRAAGARANLAAS